MSFSFEWDITPETAFGQLTAAYAAAIRNGVRQIARRRAPEIEAWMKNNARWTDRTGNARQTLHTDVEDMALDMVQIILAHGVDYGVFLELAHGGVWGIIGDAVDTWGPVVWQDVRAMLN
jgi:hypothetical protein